jgi:methionyl-tRNA formyltransferase
MMRIVFIGAVDFSDFCLKSVLKNGGDIVGIVTIKEAKNNSDFCDLTPVSDEHRIPIHYCKNVNDPQTMEWIKEKAPDVIFCWGFSQLIKKELLSLPPLGILGVHPALLPKNRGRHPLIWAKVLGLKESGLSFFRMDEGADSGPILSQERFEITEEDDASSLYRKIEEIAACQISSFLPELISGKARFFEQDVSKANTWRKRSPKDGSIDWRMSATAILNLIRALTHPYPGAEFSLEEKTVKIWKAQMYEGKVERNIEPGKIIALIDNHPVVKCYDGALYLTDLEPDINFSVGDYLK